jgi:hypothetical protein
MAFPNDEYQRNQSFIDLGALDARGTGCTGTDPFASADASERPVF